MADVWTGFRAQLTPNRWPEFECFEPNCNHPVFADQEEYDEHRLLVHLKKPVYTGGGCV